MPIIRTDTVHFLPKGMREIHRKYGLWICGFCRKGVREPVRPSELPFRKFEFYDLTHMFDGKGWCCFSNGIIRKLEKGDGILVTPGADHKCGGDGAVFVEDAISFYGPLADHLFNAGIIANGIVKIGSVRRLLSIIDLVQDNSDISQIKANFALQSLLTELYLESQRSAAVSGDSYLERLLSEIKLRPDKAWDIDAMAAFCNLSPSQFKRVFFKRTGLSPKSYIDSFKMQLAVEMLADDSKTVVGIASQLGYLDQYHFSRRFKQIKGYSPQIYRKHFMR